MVARVVRPQVLGIAASVPATSSTSSSSESGRGARERADGRPAGDASADAG